MAKTRSRKGPAPELSEAQADQLEAARLKATHSRRLKQRERLENELLGVNERIKQYEGAQPEPVIEGDAEEERSADSPPESADSPPESAEPAAPTESRALTPELAPEACESEHGPAAANEELVESFCDRQRGLPQIRAFCDEYETNTAAVEEDARSEVSVGSQMKAQERAAMLATVGKPRR